MQIYLKTYNIINNICGYWTKFEVNPVLVFDGKLNMYLGSENIYFDFINKRHTSFKDLSREKHKSRTLTTRLKLLYISKSNKLFNKIKI